MIKTRLSNETMHILKGYAQEKVKTTGMLSGRMDHLNCPAGNDSRTRLYYKVTDDHKLILGHCFNCGASGVINNDLFIKPLPGGKDPSKKYKDMAWDSVCSAAQNGNPLTPHLETWPMQYFSDCKDAFYDKYNAFNMKRGAVSGSIYIPVSDDLIYVRSMSPTNKWIKHKNPYNDTGGSCIALYSDSPDIDTCVICEDLISAMKVSMTGKAAGAALGGTSISQEEAWKLTTLYDKFIVWLDNDSAAVKDLAYKIYNTIFSYTNNESKCFIVLDKKDPKHYSLEDIKKEIQRNS